MVRKLRIRLSPRENQIVSVLMRFQNASAAEIESAMDNAPTNATVRSLLRILEQKGVVRHEKKGRMFYYFLTIPPGELKKTALEQMRDYFFGGSEASVVAAILDIRKNKLSPEDLMFIEEAIAEHSRRKK